MEYLNNLAALTDWYGTSQGRQLYRYETVQLGQLLPNCFGYQLLQIGGPNDLQWLKSSPIKHHIMLTLESFKKSNSNSFCADPVNLPFESNSIDVILLPHVLDCVANSELIINEACNVLTPGGFIIVIGLNRASLWGIQHYYHIMRTKNPYFPWFHQFTPFYDLEKMLLENNCVIDTTHIGCYQPLNLNSVELIKEHSFWDVLGALAWPIFGSIYVILARKEIHTVTPIWDKKLQSGWSEVKVGLIQQRNINNGKTD